MPYADVAVRISEEGEVLIKSPGCMVGYYKLPELTAASFTADGSSGPATAGAPPRWAPPDHGAREGALQDAKGKYVAPAPIENFINEHEAIERHA